MNSLVSSVDIANRYYRNALDILRDVVLLGIRLYVAWVFLRSGLTKIQDWSSTLALFETEYSVPILPPALAAIMGAGGELLLSPLLALGLATRFAAAGLFILNVTAVISYPSLWGFDCPAAIQSHFFWGVMLLVILSNGGGRIGADSLLNWRKIFGIFAR